MVRGSSLGNTSPYSSRMKLDGIAVVGVVAGAAGAMEYKLPSGVGATMAMYNCSCLANRASCFGDTIMLASVVLDAVAAGDECSTDW